jgi:hypothetical protein
MFVKVDPSSKFQLTVHVQVDGGGKRSTYVVVRGFTRELSVEVGACQYFDVEIILHTSLGIEVARVDQLPVPVPDDSRRWDSYGRKNEENSKNWTEIINQFPRLSRFTPVPITLRWESPYTYRIK